MNQSKNSNQFRPTLAKIDLAALAHNFGLARELVGTEIKLLGAVKANAYGHGMVSVAQTLCRHGIDALGVATPEEGMTLRQAGIKVPILLLGGPFAASGQLLAEQQLTPVVFNEAQLKHLAASSETELAIQLKVDTGMTRLGILPAELPQLLKQLANTPKLKLTGVLTHLAQADETFNGPTQAQYDCFAQVKQQLQGSSVEIFHIANSAAVLGQKLGDANWARPGIMLYGATPHPRFSTGRQLKPVMHLQTEVLSLKTVPSGTAVSYGGEWTAQRSSKIAVLPIGYADGYQRCLGNRAEVLITGQRAPVVGRVCMDLTMVDVTDVAGVALGSPVTLWGPGLPVEEVAAWAQTISYELLCGVSARVPRVYLAEEKTS